MNIIVINTAQKNELDFYINSVNPEDLEDLWAAEKNVKTGRYQLDLRFVGGVGFTDDKAYEINDKIVDFLVKLAHFRYGGLPYGMTYVFDSEDRVVLGAEFPSRIPSVVMSFQRFMDLWLRNE